MCKMLLQNFSPSILVYSIRFLFLGWSHNQQNHVLNFTDKVFKNYCADNALTGASERNVSEKVLQKFIECTCFLQDIPFITYIPTLNKYITKVPRQKLVKQQDITVTCNYDEIYIIFSFELWNLVCRNNSF